jgi:hypothetical protein
VAIAYNRLLLHRPPPPEIARKTTERSPRPDHPISIKAKAAAKDFFLGRPVDVIEGHGSDPGPDEFEFNFAIAFDTKNGLIFSFVWNLQD